MLPCIVHVLSVLGVSSEKIRNYVYLGKCQKEFNKPMSVPTSLMTFRPFGLVQTPLFATLSFMLLAKQSSYIVIVKVLYQCAPKPPKYAMFPLQSVDRCK